MCGPWSSRHGKRPVGGYHQHFNTSPEPIRYVVPRRGNPELRGERRPVPQIEYEDEDPAVRELFESRLRKRGLDPRSMDEYRSEGKD